MSAKVTVETTRKNTDVMAVVDSTTLNKSQKIRTLFGMGVAKAEIALLLEIKYQFVRNVLLQPVKDKPVVEPVREMVEGDL